MSLTEFKIKGLNQEKNLNIISKKFKIYELKRHSKNCSSFKVSFFKAKKVRKLLISFGYEILEEKNHGILPKIFKTFGNIYILSAIIFSLVIYLAQSPIIWRYELLGEQNLTQAEVVGFVKENFTKNKFALKTKAVEGAIYENFEEISFVSVIIRGQTLIINIKEKLLPDEIYGDFEPVVAEFDGKVTNINLISGTMNVKVDDYVEKGDVLVLPYFLDGNGEINPVKPSAEITFEVYGEGEVVHYDHSTEIRRTGNFYEKNEVQLFGLTIYANGEDNNFELFETEEEIVNLSSTLLPFKLKRTICYELEEVEVNETFEEAEEKILFKAREKALLNSANYGIINDEFYTVRHFDGGASVNYVIVYEKIISAS